MSEEEDLYTAIMTAAENIDEYVPSEEDFIDVPMVDLMQDGTEQVQKGIFPGSDDDVTEEPGLIFYGVGDDVEVDPYAPSFRTK